MNNITSQPEKIQNQAQEIKAKCTDAILNALERYHYPGMGTEELKIIVRNVIENRVELPERINNLA